MKNRFLRFPVLSSAVAIAPILAMPVYASAATVANPLCPTNTALFDPDSGKDIIVPPGFTVSAFRAGLNFPTGIAFRGNKENFEVYVLESGHGLPSRCNEQSNFGSGDFDPKNPFTPDIVVFDSNGKLLRTLAKPAASGGFQPAGPAVDIAFERGAQGGRLFATDSNQATHAQGQNNSSRIVIVDPDSGKVTPFISALPTGDHPTEQLAFKDVPIRDVLAGPPQTVTSPLAIEAADSSFTGIDFVPRSFVGGPVAPGAALYTLEGDFGFSPPNATSPAPEVGHELKLINFEQNGHQSLALKVEGFARNVTGDQAFISPDHPSGFNRPTMVRFGPDGCAYVADYGAVRDNGEDTHFVGAENGPLVQVPGTGVIWKICKK